MIESSLNSLAAGSCTIQRAEQTARWTWTPRIARQAWLAGGEAVGAAGEGRAEGEHSSTFSSRAIATELKSFFVKGTSN